VDQRVEAGMDGRHRVGLRLDGGHQFSLELAHPLIGDVVTRDELTQLNPETGKDEWVVDYIEGPSIKCANAVSRLFGNNDTDVRVFDTGTHWLFYARFMDLETGYCLTRPFQQRKNQGSVRGDSGRAEDIAFQIGTSKAIRNVTCNALEFFTSFAADEAKRSIVEKVGEKLDYYKKRVSDRLQEIGIDIKRVEHARGRALKDWLATDVARTIAELQAINDGMATADETYPPLETKQETAEQKAGEAMDKFASGDGDAQSAETKQGTNNAAQDAQQKDPQSETASPPAATDNAGGAEAEVSPAPSPTNASAPTNSTDPQTDAEYKAHARKWIDEQINPEECRARWAREKAMRDKAGVTSETRSECEGLMKAKVAALKGKAKEEAGC
jgi:hypothetical protein